MDLFVIRHAIAADARPEQKDEDRPLTRDGRERFEKAVEGMTALGIQLERVLFSPWKRAADTAGLLRKITFGPLEPTPDLTKAPSEALLKKLSRHVEEGPLAVVGHQPYLGQLIALLVAGNVERDLIDLKKGSVVWLEGEPKKGGMRLRAYLPPRVLRAIRKRGSH